MAKGFEIETALGAPFSLAKRRPVSVFVWGLLSFLPVLPLIPLMMPIWVEALKPGVSDNMMIGQILAANLGAQLVQVLQWVAAIFVIAAASRAVLVEPRMRASRFFFLGFGMAELMVAVIYIPSWAKAFHTVPITLGDWGVALAVGGGGFILVEAGKWVAARRRPASQGSGA
jgi:hypothetical protein